MKNKSKNIRVMKTEDILNLYSYGVHVCQYNKTEDIITLGKKWDFSITTRKHVYDFLKDFGFLVDGKMLEKSIECGYMINDKMTKVFYDGGME